VAQAAIPALAQQMAEAVQQTVVNPGLASAGPELEPVGPVGRELEPVASVGQNPLADQGRRGLPAGQGPAEREPSPEAGTETAQPFNQRYSTFRISIRSYAKTSARAAPTSVT
jgi:hypothetical protein